MTEALQKRRTVFSWVDGVRVEHLVAGVSGGVASTVLLHPLDLLKIRFAVNDGHSTVRPTYAGIKNAVVSIVKTDGVRGLYAGMSPNVVGAGASWGFYFFFYNIAKSSLQDGNQNKQLSAGYHLLAASASGVLTLTMTNPVWVVKTRLCLQSSKMSPDVVKYSGLTDALVKIARQEGLRGLYSGFVPGLFGVSHGAIQFVTYEELKKHYHNYHNQPITTKLGNTEYLCFAALSKFVAAFTTYPYQVVRTRLQDLELKYSGSLDCIRRTYRGEGLAGFYKGLAPNLLRVVPATMITFVVYENISYYMLRRSSSSSSRSA